MGRSERPLEARSPQECACLRDTTWCDEWERPTRPHALPHYIDSDPESERHVKSPPTGLPPNAPLPGERQNVGRIAGMRAS